MTLLLPLLSLVAFLSPAFAAVNPPDYKVEVGEEQNAKMRGWLIQFTPPEKHHFNVKAPMKVTSGGLDFIKAGASESKVGFRLSSPQLKEGDPVEASLFLCDAAKTYCIKKVQTFPLKANSDLKKLEIPAEETKPVPTPKPKKKKVAQKDEFGFWDNDLEAAITDAARTHRPILIDFYGIWCPPCNLFNETVFPKAKFKAAAQSWVLLKMDVDDPVSFSLKSHFKVGGYPTMIAVKEPGAKAELNQLAEIDRLVGFFPEVELVAKMKTLHQDRNLSLEQKLSAQKENVSATLKQLIQVKREKKEVAEALSLSEEGVRSFPQDHFFALQSLALRVQDKPELLKEETNLMLLRAIHANRAKESTETLLHLEELLVSESEHFQRDQLIWTTDLLDTIASRVNPQTLSVPGVELSIADLDSLKVDAAEVLKDEALQKKSYADAVKSYQKLIALYHGENSRGLNLELAYLYWKTGEIEKAKKLYSRFITKYPSEFTFYYAASRMYMELKEFSIARSYAEKAVQFAYGDNQIRSMERLVRIMNAQGEKSAATSRGKEFLAKTVKADDALAVRTNRYVQALQKAVDEAGKI